MKKVKRKVYIIEYYDSRDSGIESVFATKAAADTECKRLNDADEDYQYVVSPRLVIGKE